MRKPPIKHNVKKHTRQGRPVRSYTRGKGIKSKITIKRKVRVVDTKGSGGSKQTYFSESSKSFADVSIVPFIKKINKMGFDTIASCSGISADHPVEKGSAYLSVILPESVARKSVGGDMFEVSARDVKDKEYIQTLMEAGWRAGWKSELSKYMMFLPTVHFELPTTGSRVTDHFVERGLKEEQKKVDKIMENPAHTTKEFLDAIHRRNRKRESLEKKYGGKAKRTDVEIKRMWRRLVSELSKIKKIARKK